MPSSPSQAWAILDRHARDEIGPLRLQELCSDNDRVSSLVSVHTLNENASSRLVNSVQNASGAHGYPKETSLLNLSNRILIVDISRQLMTLETLNHLLRLSSAVDMRGFIQTLAWGQNNRLEPFVPSQAIPDSPVSNNIRSHQIEEPEKEVSNAICGTNISHYLKKTRFDDDVTGSVFGNTPQSLVGGFYPAISSTTSHRLGLQTSPSMHLALRAPAHVQLQMLTHDGANAVEDVHDQWKRIQLFSNSIRKGQLRGIGGHTFQNILIVGRGVAFSAIQFIYHSLRREDEGAAALCQGLSDFPSLGNVVSNGRKSNLGKDGRSMRFLSSLDPIATTSVLADWNPECTMIVTLAPKGDETDILKLTQTLKEWLYKGLKSYSKRYELVCSKHVWLITGNHSFNRLQKITKPECVFLIPQFARFEAFNTFSAAGLVPLSIAFGWDIVQEVLNGAHDMDSHFVETNPRHNIPVLLALVDLWNDYFLPKTSREPCGGRMITPFMDSFASYPKFVAAIEAQVCGRINNGGTRVSSSRVAPFAMVIDGGVCGTYDRVEYQGGRAPPVEMIIAMESQVPHRNHGSSELGQVLLGGNNGEKKLALTNQDHVVCSFFAHADVMAFGSGGMRSRDGRNGGSPFHFGGLGSTSFDSLGQASMLMDQDVAEGNRPSTLLICDRCDAFTCGQLIALAEHRALVTARLWDVDNPAFTQSHASVLRTKQTDVIREKLEAMYQHLSTSGNDSYEEDDDIFADSVGPKLNLSVTTLLGHYATRMRNQERAGEKRK